MLTNNKIIEQFTSHNGFELDSDKLTEQVTAILFSDNPLRLKQQLTGKKAPLVSVRVNETPSGPWLQVSLAGSKADIRLSVERADRGYKLLGITSPSRTEPGRPVGPGGARSVTFRLMLTPTEREELTRLAEGEGCTPSQFVRTRVFGQ